MGQVEEYFQAVTLLNKLILGDSGIVLTELDDNSVDTIVTDPPYGLEFMSKDWDKTLPSIEIWEECIRVLKPGGFAFIMCASRSNLMARLTMDLEYVGFETEFTPVYWSYATGFPKATKVKDVFAGFQPKPAVEPILVVMKPLDEKTYTAQFENNSRGVTNLNDARIPVDDEGIPRETVRSHEEGRFPANLIVQNDSLNTGKIKKSGKLEKHHNYSANSYQGTDTFKMRDRTGEIETYGDEGSYSRFFDLDLWFYNNILERLTELPDEVKRTYPFLVTPKPSVSEKNEGLEDVDIAEAPVLKYHRPTTLKNPDNWNILPSEVPHGGANRGGNQQNSHPTVKPIKLMSWLVILGSRENEVVLDPFVGSGTTAMACVLTNRRYIGVEMNSEYFEIAIRRIKAYKAKIRPHKKVTEGL